MTQFETMGINPEILQAIKDIGYEEPTPIQLQAIPEILAGKDMIGQAQKGAGKTAAFGIPLVQKVDTEIKGIQGLVLTPTREMCIQITEELEKVSQKIPGLRIASVYGGQPIEKQITGLREIPHIVVGTPGRLLDHLDRGTIRLYHVRMTVLDAADDMLDMGFRDEMENILDQLPSRRQTVLFAATMSPKITSFATSYLHESISIHIQADSQRDVQPLRTPTSDDVPDTKIAALVKIIKETIETGSLDVYMGLLENLSETLSPTVVAAALLKLHLGNIEAASTLSEAPSFSEEDLEQASIRPGKARLVLNVGRRDGVSVKEILNLFAVETGLTSYFLGDIVLADTATYVDVPIDQVMSVFKGLEGVSYSTTPLVLKLVHKVRDAAQLQRDMAEQRSRRDQPRRQDQGDRQNQNRRFPQGGRSGERQQPRYDRNNQANASSELANSHGTQSPPVQNPQPRPPQSDRSAPTPRPQMPRQDRAPRENRDYRKPSAVPYFPASSSQQHFGV